MPDRTDSAPRRSPFADLSWLQVAAGALAAMTSAWIASALGVGGTIIGAALGSLVVTLSSTFYASTLDRSRTLIVQTDGGSIVRTEVEEGHTADVLAAVQAETDEDVTSARVEDETRRTIRWKVVALTTAIVLAVSGLAMGGYELVTGKSYGTNSDNARIGNPFGGGSDSSDPDSGTSPAPSSAPTPSQKSTPTAPTTTSAPEPSLTPEPTVSESPSAEPTEPVE